MSEGMMHYLNVFINLALFLLWFWLFVNAFFHSTRRWYSILIPAFLFSAIAIALWLLGDKETIVSALFLAAIFMFIAFYQRRMEKMFKEIAHEEIGQTD